MADIPRLTGAVAVGLVVMAGGVVGAVVAATFLVLVGTPFGLPPQAFLYGGLVFMMLAAYAPAARLADGLRERLEAGTLRPRMDARAETSAKKTAAAAASIVGTYGLVGLVERYGFGGVLYAGFLEVIGFIQGVGDSITAPLFAFADGLARVVAAMFPARIVNAAADFTADSITIGDWNFFGPATFAVGVVATMAGIWVFVLFLRRIDFSAATALFSRR